MTPGKYSDKIGMEPGALVHIGDRKQDESRISVIEYDEKELHEYLVKNTAECTDIPKNDYVSWVNIDGIHDVDLIKEMGLKFNLHNLLLEDVLNTRTRPKLEEYTDHIFFTLKMLQLDEDTDRITSEQVSFVLGSNYVISFQEQEGDVFEPIRDRIRNAKGKVRLKPTDYLLYLLLDIVVDNYFIILEQVEEHIDKLEEEIIELPKDHHTSQILTQKRYVADLKKVILPLKEDINKLIKIESRFIDKKNRHYFTDLYDHINHILDELEARRETLNTLMDMYVSTISNKMNEVMKVLTIIATIFIPLTFIAGIYGMNFQYMPELTYKWGYFGVLGIMGAVTIGMIFYFRKKKWL